MGDEEVLMSAVFKQFYQQQLRPVDTLKTVYLVKLPRVPSAAIRTMPQVKTSHTKLDNVYYSEGHVTEDCVWRAIQPTLKSGERLFSGFKGLKSKHTLMQ